MTLGAPQVTLELLHLFGAMAARLSLVTPPPQGSFPPQCQSWAQPVGDTVGTTGDKAKGGGQAPSAACPAHRET